MTRVSNFEEKIRRSLIAPGLISEDEDITPDQAVVLDSVIRILMIAFKHGEQESKSVEGIIPRRNQGA